MGGTIYSGAISKRGEFFAVGCNDKLVLINSGEKMEINTKSTITCVYI